MRKRADTAGSVLSPQVTLAEGFRLCRRKLVGLFGHRSVGHAALWSHRSIGHATLWSKIPRAVTFAGPTHRLGENMDFDGLQLAIRSWSCRSANKASRLDIG